MNQSTASSTAYPIPIEKVKNGYDYIIRGGIFAAVMVIRKDKEKKDLIPFGPFLCIGIAAAIFTGDIAMDLYIETILGI